MDIREFIARRVAKEFKDGDVINVGIGIPLMSTRFISPDITVHVHSENGIIRMGESPELLGLPIDPDITDAGGNPKTILPGGSFFDSLLSFALIRGGHLDTTVLGALQVDEEGNLANWIIPGKLVPGIGGAMDLAVGSNRVIVAMEHTAKGNPKILKQCTLPLTARKKVNLIITEMGVFEITSEGMTLTEISSEVTVKDIQECTEANFSVSPNLKIMEV
ncbi:MAG: Butyrate--acetoacetate CoA-transferase subunit B [candidate division WS2 bacterium]|uniref:Butyrate--acetoacetate CoA-transferase subunit B n=1 Tax=Psychracetigena formicireducens TaxID=2986056 RepID=A0A9E2F2C0_PSYF1|nr:Butyrate--acetoacetate CoA-transferase subunit B [Candidatus Psychracetigena formicireducens]MBT9145497.1 Butyrate--acetoacetate CoA-transferase subunit B [Candidatus Psychracetigena formicireducens]MBT9150802.1 Butyrate--acetoacetate CoA-transferase subunit B [Candidatus Psychracetigena formicireducens]